MNVKFIYEIYTTSSSKSKFHENRLSGGDTLGEKWFSAHNFHNYCPFWVKFGIGVAHIMLFQKCEFRENL